ncbi:CaiB/BaiF CoA transferase family protein [Streptomyces sp. NPDC059618]|uniref:CaiB/BaiF CoA transferase family protein n=1 Tax=Streptomyces sp. NPDC059618 TaxID=3346887 RepID=UPI0036A045B5
MSGPLDGVRVVEIAGVGPAAFAAMLLADMGAEVVRVDRVDATEQVPGMEDPRFRIPERSRRSVAVDLKSPEGAGIVLRLAETADVVVEGFRPGVAERLGVGPEACRARNPRLVYGRMTGWGRRGPLSGRAGHDINFISVAGALHPVGLAGQPPVPPVNLVGEGGGGMLLAFGIVCALLEARRSGAGQVVDAGIVDGAAVLLASVLGMRAAGAWNTERGTNTLDSGAPFYGTYRCADGEYVAVGAAERPFFDRLLKTLGVDGDPRVAGNRLDPGRWDAMKECIAEAFAARSRAHWTAVFDDVDACVTPVLSLDEAVGHPHNRARGTFLDIEGVVHPAAAPRFSRTRPGAPRPPAAPGRDSAEVLRAAGYSHQQITGFVERHVVAFQDRPAVSAVDRTGGRTPC